MGAYVEFKPNVFVIGLKFYLNSNHGNLLLYRQTQKIKLSYFDG